MYASNEHYQTKLDKNENIKNNSSDQWLGTAEWKAHYMIWKKRN
jgi:hypothetical protein